MAKNKFFNFSGLSKVIDCGVCVTKCFCLYFYNTILLFRLIDFFGNALVIYKIREKTIDIYCNDKNKIYEILKITSLDPIDNFSK